jgi:von Willebrand factor type A C-terminal domain
MGASVFTVDIDHNPYLAPGGREVNAIATVTRAGSPADQAADTGRTDGAGPAMSASTATETGAITLRVWTPQHATVRFLTQVTPTVEDLRCTQSAPQAADYPTGAWRAERRAYHLSVHISDPAPPGMGMLAARVFLIARTASGPQTLGQGYVQVTWTDDEALTVLLNHAVARYTGQAELAQAIAVGMKALEGGDTPTAVARLGRAVQLAHQSGNQEMLTLLAMVVQVIDPATGTVLLKRSWHGPDDYI